MVIWGASELGCRQRSVGCSVSGLRWVAMSRDWCEPSWQDGCVAGPADWKPLVQGRPVLDFFTCARLFSRVLDFLLRQKVEHRPASNRQLLARRPSHTTILPGRLTSILRHCYPSQPTAASRPLPAAQLTCAPYDHLFILRYFSVYDCLFILT